MQQKSWESEEWTEKKGCDKCAKKGKRVLMKRVKTNAGSQYTCPECGHAGFGA